MSILGGLKLRYELHHGVRIRDEALRAAAKLSSTETSVEESMPHAEGSTHALRALRELLSATSFNEIMKLSHELIQLLSLGKIEQGSISSDSKSKSLNARWYGTKNETKKGKVTEDNNTGDGIFIERDSLVSLKVKRGKSESIHIYRVLSIFSKHSNKWLYHLAADKIPFVEDSMKKYKIMVRMMEGAGEGYDNVELTKDGIWSPKAVYRIATVKEVINVKEKVVSSNNVWVF